MAQQKLATRIDARTDEFGFLMAYGLTVNEWRHLEPREARFALSQTTHECFRRIPTKAQRTASLPVRKLDPVTPASTPARSLSLSAPTASSSSTSPPQLRPLLPPTKSDVGFGMPPTPRNSDVSCASMPRFKAPPDSCRPPGPIPHTLPEPIPPEPIPPTLPEPTPSIPQFPLGPPAKHAILEARRRSLEALKAGIENSHLDYAPACGAGCIEFNVRKKTRDEVPPSLLHSSRIAVEYLKIHHPEVAAPLVIDALSTACDIKIGLCTCVLNRKYQLEHVLPISLANAWAHRRWVNFYIVDFNSQDDVVDWILESFPEAIALGFLHIYQVKDYPYFHASVCKNTAHRVAIEDECDIVVNVDADNIITADFAEHIVAKMNRDQPAHKRADILQMHGEQRSVGTYGRIAIFASDFEYIRGYDEDTYPAGAQDTDILARLAYLKRRQVALPIAACAIQNTKDETLKYVDPKFAKMTWKEMDRANGKKLQKLRNDEGRFICNGRNAEYPYYGAMNAHPVHLLPRENRKRITIELESSKRRISMLSTTSTQSVKSGPPRKISLVQSLQSTQSVRTDEQEMSSHSKETEKERGSEEKEREPETHSEKSVSQAKETENRERRVSEQRVAESRETKESEKGISVQLTSQENSQEPRNSPKKSVQPPSQRNSVEKGAKETRGVGAWGARETTPVETQPVRPDARTRNNKPIRGSREKRVGRNDGWDNTEKGHDWRGNNSWDEKRNEWSGEKRTINSWDKKRNESKTMNSWDEKKNEWSTSDWEKKNWSEDWRKWPATHWPATNNWSQHNS